MRTWFLFLGACGVLGSCGPKFSAGGSSSGGSGSGGDSAGARASSGSDNAGEAGDPGSDGGRGGSLPMAGSPSGGTDGGSAGAIVDHGGTGGVLNVAGKGGASSAGTGGVIDPPMIPQLRLDVWLRADLGVIHKAGVVQQWQDQSGNQLNAVQLTALSRPKLVDDAVTGLPAIEFDGENDFLSFAEGFGDFSRGLTSFVVAKPTASDCASMVELSNGSEIDDIALGMWQNKWTYEVDQPLLQAGDVDLTGFTLHSVVHRPLSGMPSADLRINGAVLQSMQMPLPASPTDLVRRNNFVGHTLYGSCNYFQGQIAEIIIYQRALTPAEVQGIETYLVDHWKLDRPAPAP